MNKLTLVLSVLACVILAASAASSVVDLTTKNFDKEVLASEVPYMVEFFAPWCGHCQSLAPEWEKAAKNLKGILPIGKVDCTQEAKLCAKYGVQGYPSIKCFSENGKKVQDYQQARQGAAVVKFATEQLANNVVSIKDVAALDKFLGQSGDLPHVILFTSKSDVSPLMKVLSIRYKNRVLVGQVQQSAAEVVQKYKVESFPTILSVKGSDVTNFNGAITPEEVTGFVSGLTGEEVPETEKKTEAKPASKPISKPTTLSEFTNDNLDATCESKLCIIGVVGVNEDGSVVEEERKVLQEVLDGFKGDGKFVFGWADRTKKLDVVQKFGVSSSEPSFVVYNAKRSKFAKSETFDVKSAKQLMERVVGGDVTYTPL